MHQSTKNGDLTRLPVSTHPLREVTVDIESRDLRPAAAGMDVVIVRVCGLAGPSGRPVSRSIRIPADMLRDNDEWAL